MPDYDDLTGDEGGEAACYTHLLCAQCGMVLGASDHAVDCPSALEDPLTTPAD